MAHYNQGRSNATPHYVYEELSSSTSIRILKIQPSSESTDTVICELDEEVFQPGKTSALKYEALSYCWGTAPERKEIKIKKKQMHYPFQVSPNLESALRALRKSVEERFLWIDAICINQNNIDERNQQVTKMDLIYGNAENVCIWLGPGDDRSKLAMDFIKNNVLRLWDFDKLCENIEKSQEWAALITLMKREWFSRRWVVQEIALSRRGTVHCGDEEIDWQAFADAVSLFVEVESATHRLSDVMKMNAEFHHIPNFFGDVSSLGAALLVEATSNLFRKSSETGSKEPLSSLEYLVSRLSAFESTRPHDTIYALLAIAKDTTPGKKGSEGHDENLEGMPRNMKYVVTQWGREKASKQEYNVDYKLPAEDVYKEFIEFAIGKAPGTRALDIICRPWAPPVYEEGEPTIIEDAGLLWMSPARRYAQRVRTAKQLPSWIPSIEGAAFKMGEHPTAGWKMNRRNADALVGLADGTTGQRNYFAAGTRRFDPKKLRFKKGKGFHAMFVEGFIIDKIATKHEKAAGGEIPKNWPRREHWEPVESEPPEEFWRTLVADRGPNGRNPPTFYQRACKEAITRIVKHGIKTKELIDEGRCTIISQFLRRVQEVVWDRCLMRTEDGRLGLIHEEAQEGFEICILYGCSVPVVLQRCVKQPEEISVEKDEDKRQ
ncbi:HET-domain-containing protein, partial [Saccharata proteae CBS 121410]